jgi:antitoxin component YwqK of YwqJK toxin-antitoxin module
VQYVVIESEEADTELSCPTRSDFRTNERASWCETNRGTKHGPYVQYHLNGEVKEEGYYEYGDREGVWVEYHTTGAIRLEGEYHHGERVGTWVRYDRSGNETTVTDYR